MRLDIMRPRSGRTIFLLGVNERGAPIPRVGEDRLRLVWIGADGEHGYSLPIAGSRPPGTGVPLLVHSIIRAGHPDLDRLLSEARAAERLHLSLPGIEPIELPNAGVAEAWAALDACAPR